MNWQVLQGHAVDFLKGLIAVVAVNAALAALQYIGTEIPVLIHMLAPATVAYGTIHFTKS